MFFCVTLDFPSSLLRVSVERPDHPDLPDLLDLL